MPIRPSHHSVFSPLAGASALVFLSPLAFAESTQPVHVVGLLGGWERSNDPNRGVYKLVIKLRETPGIDAECFSNHRRRVALKHLLRKLDTNADHKLDAKEKAAAKIVLFGQSLGGSQTVALARDLRKRGIPVLLTVQVDSVGLRDSRIPDNVRAAANFYQREVLTIRGEDRITAADPAKTRILGNIQFHYPPFLPSHARPESRARRWFGGGHARMEADPLLWLQVESIIRAEIARSGQ